MKLFTCACKRRKCLCQTDLSVIFYFDFLIRQMASLALLIFFDKPKKFTLAKYTFERQYL